MNCQLGVWVAIHAQPRPSRPECLSEIYSCGGHLWEERCDGACGKSGVTMVVERMTSFICHHRGIIGSWAMIVPVPCRTRLPTPYICLFIPYICIHIIYIYIYVYTRVIYMYTYYIYTHAHIYMCCTHIYVCEYATSRSSCLLTCCLDAHRCMHIHTWHWGIDGQSTCVCMWLWLVFMRVTWIYVSENPNLRLRSL